MAWRSERPLVVLLLVVHAALAIWGAARNSVTFDENFHLPAGVMTASRAEFRISAVNPPLVKAFAGAAALAAGARLPTPAALAVGEQGVVGESFMRQNADRYHRVFFAARLVVVALSVLLGILIWRFARRLHGARGGVLALAFYAFMPEALAHAGVVTMDLATGLGWLASVYGFWGFVRTGRWHWWALCALAVGFTFLVRFTAFLLPVVLLALAVASAWLGRMRRPRRVWLGLALLAPATVLLVDAGFLFQLTLDPLREWGFHSHFFQHLRASAPWLRLPVPDAYVAGFDRQLVESENGLTPSYLLGTLHRGSRWYYFPIALLVKWPLGWIAALVTRGVTALRSGWSRRRLRDGAFLALPVMAYLGAAMLARLNIGIRYLFPILPFACVWLGGLAPRAALRARSWRSRAWGWCGVALALAQGVETVAAAPWYLAFFNRAVGGPGRGDRIVNDSNVDWGQGLIALRHEMEARGIGRIYLIYHGTTDPAMYGIDYIPLTANASIGDASDWLAVSSFFYVGQSQRMMTQQGRTGFNVFDLHAFDTLAPVARPAGCMYLFRLRAPVAYEKGFVPTPAGSAGSQPPPP